MQIGKFIMTDARSVCKTRRSHARFERVSGHVQPCAALAAIKIRIRNPGSTKQATILPITAIGATEQIEIQYDNVYIIICNYELSLPGSLLQLIVSGESAFSRVFVCSRLPCERKLMRIVVSAFVLSLRNAEPVDSSICKSSSRFRIDSGDILYGRNTKDSLRRCVSKRR